MKSLKIKIDLNKNQELILNTLSNEHRLLYNYLLNYLKENELDFKKLNQKYKEYRLKNKLTISSKSAQNTCRSLMHSIKSYLSLKKKDKTAKFPYKFKSHKYFQTFMYDCNGELGGGYKVVNNVLTINLLSASAKSKKLIIKLPEYCKNINNIKTLTFKKENEYYYLCMTYENPIVNNNLNKDNFLSIDPGLKNIVTAFSNKNVWFNVKNKTFKSLEKQIKECQSKLDKKVKYSKKWKKLKKRFLQLNKKLSNSNKDFQHKVSSKIVNFCKNNDIGTIIIGDIQTKELPKSKISSKSLNKSSQNRGTLSRFQTFLDYKSKNENIDFYEQNESYTSKTNCLTDTTFSFKMDLSIRQVKLDNDLTIDRDLNGSINIAKKAKVTWFDQIDLKEYLLSVNRIYVDNFNNH